MRIRQLLERIPELVPADGLPDLELSDVVCDSRQVTPGVLYAAIPGVSSDGHVFLPQAAEKGAAAAVVSRPDAVFPGPVLKTGDPRGTYALIAREFAGCPDRDLCMLGVTGTNGKTTTAYLMAALAGTRAAGGLLSTVEVRTPKSRQDSNCTTPDSRTFFRLAGQVRSEGGKFLAMELSSHALDQKRTAGVKFQAAVFTNLTGDHLDYHGDMEHYFQAKKLFFTELLAPEGCAVINIDDPWGKQLASELSCRKITFGEDESAMCHITDPHLTAEGVYFSLKGAYDLEIRSPLFGLYNIHNITGAALAVLSAGVKPETVVSALAAPEQVPGRLERVNSRSQAAFFVDYAHTDDALTNVLNAVRPGVGGKLTIVFGAGGDRDRTKRPRMGKAAAQGADFLIVTSDNPRSEDPEAIIAGIVAGIPAGTPYKVIADRREAIRFAVQNARQGDVVIVAGKGHENYQEICGVRKHFSDRETLEEFLK